MSRRPPYVHFRLEKQIGPPCMTSAKGEIDAGLSPGTFPAERRLLTKGCTIRSYGTSSIIDVPLNTFRPKTTSVRAMAAC